MKRAWLVAALLPVAASAQEGMDRWDAGSMPGQQGQPVIGAPLGSDDPPHEEALPRVLPPSPPAAPGQLSELRRLLVGKPVHGSGTGRIGTVSDVVIGADRRVTNITIQVDAALDPDRANLPVPYAWVARQLDQPILVVPWDPALVAWLTEPGRPRRAAAAEPPPPEDRAAWESAAEAQLEQWRARVPNTAAAKDDSSLRQLQLAYGAARTRLDRLKEAEPEDWTNEQAKMQAELDDLGQAWSELAEAR